MEEVVCRLIQAPSATEVGRLRPPTARQNEVLNFVRRFVREHNTAPSRPEIAAAIGVRNKSTVTDHLEALARKGCIAIQPGKERYIRLLTGDLPIVIAGHVSAGEPILADEHMMGTLPRTVEEAFLPRPDFFLRAKGDSMNLRGYVDGALVAIKSQSDAKNGEVVVARLEDEVTLKRFFRSDARNVELRPDSSNPTHQPIMVDLKHQPFEIAGVAVGALIGDGFNRPGCRGGGPTNRMSAYSRLR